MNDVLLVPSPLLGPASWAPVARLLGARVADTAARAAVEAEQPRMPLAYFTAEVDVPDGWADRPSAYLAFGDTYAEEIGFALACGWPVATLPGRHLHQLVAPAEVAAAITALRDQV